MPPRPSFTNAGSQQGRTPPDGGWPVRSRDEIAAEVEAELRVRTRNAKRALDPSQEDEDRMQDEPGPSASSGVQPGQQEAAAPTLLASDVADSNATPMNTNDFPTGERFSQFAATGSSEGNVSTGRSDLGFVFSTPAQAGAAARTLAHPIDLNTAPTFTALDEQLAEESNDEEVCTAMNWLSIRRSRMSKEELLREFANDPALNVTGQQDAAQHIAEDLPSMPADNSDEAFIQRVVECLHQAGVVLKAIDDLPTKDDYAMSHKKLWVLWGLDWYADIDISDLYSRHRIAARYLHPDKHAGSSEKVQKWAQATMQLLNNAKDIAVLFMQLLKDRVIRAPPRPRSGVGYQEIPWDLQLWMVKMFPLDLLISNTTETKYDALTTEGLAKAIPGRKTRCPPPAYNAAFLKDFLSDDVKMGLWDFVSGLFPKGCPKEADLHIGIVAQRLSREWVMWLAEELKKWRGWMVRYSLPHLHFHIVIFADAFPTSWQNLRLYFNHPMLDRHELRTLEAGVTWLSPPLHLVALAGKNMMSLLKHAAIVNVGTQELTPVELEACSKTYDWQDTTRLDFLNTEQRLWFDCGIKADRQVTTMCEDMVIAMNDALPTEQQTIHIVDHRVRSWGDSPALKRRAIVVSFPAKFDFLSPIFRKWIAERMHKRQLRVLIGTEKMFGVPLHSWIVSAKSLKWLENLDLLHMIGKSVAESKFSVVLTLASPHTSEDLKRMADWHNANCLDEDARVTKIQNSAGATIWSGNQKEVANQMTNRPLSMPSPSNFEIVILWEGATIFQVRQLTNWLLEDAEKKLAIAGFALPTNIQGHFREDKGKVLENKVLLTGPDEIVMRSVYFKYKDNSFAPPGAIGRLMYSRMASTLFDGDWRVQENRIAATHLQCLTAVQSVAIGKGTLILHSDKPAAKAMPSPKMPPPIYTESFYHPTPACHAEQYAPQITSASSEAPQQPGLAYPPPPPPRSDVPASSSGQQATTPVPHAASTVADSTASAAAASAAATQPLTSTPPSARQTVVDSMENEVPFGSAVPLSSVVTSPPQQALATTAPAGEAAQAAEVEAELASPEAPASVGATQFVLHTNSDAEDSDEEAERQARRFYEFGEVEGDVQHLSGTTHSRGEFAQGPAAGGN